MNTGLLISGELRLPVPAENLAHPGVLWHLERSKHAYKALWHVLTEQSKVLSESLGQIAKRTTTSLFWNEIEVVLRFPEEQFPGVYGETCIARMKNRTSEKMMILFQTITIHDFNIMTNYYSKIIPKYFTKDLGRDNSNVTPCEWKGIGMAK